MGDLYSNVPYCAALAGQGDGVHATRWHWMQIFAWFFLFCIGWEAAWKWRTNWGKLHGEVGAFLGAAKTVGFAIVDVMSIFVLFHGREAFKQLEQWRHKSSRSIDNPQPATEELGVSEQVSLTLAEEEEYQTELRVERVELVLWGIGLAIAQALYWSLFLWDTRSKFKGDTWYASKLGAGGLMLIATSPGLVCSIYPAIAGRVRAGAIFNSFVKKVRDEVEEKNRELRTHDKMVDIDWTGFQCDYAVVEKHVRELSGNLTYMAASWMCTILVYTVTQGISIWLWRDKTSHAPNSVYMTRAFAVLYGALFLRVYYKFPGVFSGELRHLAKARLECLSNCSREQYKQREEEVRNMQQAVEYFEANRICWIVEPWTGFTLELNTYRGRYVSVPFILNLVSNFVPQAPKQAKRAWHWVCEAIGMPLDVPDNKKKGRKRARSATTLLDPSATRATDLQVKAKVRRAAISSNTNGRKSWFPSRAEARELAQPENAQQPGSSFLTPISSIIFPSVVFCLLVRRPWHPLRLRRAHCQ
mmetsp:Transcript_13856/g.25446  ORF Transcript_13856/g.25446 Transcript_13856/m.25446 type:complete len:529 (+) Transcript_13856:45-1631(+)